MSSEGASKRRRLVWSMILLAIVVVVAGGATMAVTGYFRSKDPIYQCIDNPSSQPYQLSIPISVTTDGIPGLVPKGIGIESDCIRPVHTLQENVIHVAWAEPYPFTLGHFLYYWKIDLSKYNTAVYVNDVLYKNGNFLDLVLKEGMSIRIEFTSR